MNDSEIEELVDYLRNHGPKKAKEIARHFNHPDPVGGQQTHTRNLITKAINEGHFILGNSGYGYIIAEKSGDIGKKVSSMRGRIAAMKKKVDILIEEWNIQNPDDPFSDVSD